jgi:hypothetical protein
MSLAQLRALFQIGLLQEPKVFSVEVDQGDKTALYRIDGATDFGIAADIAKDLGPVLAMALHKSMTDMMLREKYRVEEQRKLDAIQVHATLVMAGEVI